MIAALLIRKSIEQPVLIVSVRAKLVDEVTCGFQSHSVKIDAHAKLGQTQADVLVFAQDYTRIAFGCAEQRRNQVRLLGIEMRE